MSPVTTTDGVTRFDGVSAGIAAATQLNELIGGVVFEWDGTNSASYPGTGQAVSNITPSPADGSSQSAYNFRLGTSASPDSGDPTFSDPDFVFDGDDRILLEGLNTTFLGNIHNTSQTSLEVSFVTSLFWPAATTTGIYYICGTNNASPDQGFYFAYDRGNQEFELRHYSGSGSVQDTSMGSGIILNGDDWNLITFTMQKTSGTGGNWKLRVNGDTTLTGTLTTWLASTLAPGDRFQFSGVSGSARFPNNARATSFSCTNTFLSETQIQNVHSFYAARHNRPIYNQ